MFDSPLEQIRAFEMEQGLPPGLVNSTVAGAGSGGAWARHERGELDTEAFLVAFADELAVAGYDVDTAELMRRIKAALRPRPQFLSAISRLREAGIGVAAVTNNWEPFGDDPIVSRFDVFVESVVEGVRKPDPEIYRRALDRLGCEPSSAVMLDDLGPNLKTARAMGMTTIKVEDPAEALRLLGELVGVDLAAADNR